MISRAAIVCVAGALGTGLRYFAGLSLSRLSATLPWATLFVNLLGSFSMAWIAAFASRSAALSETSRIALTTGLLGGFTTYSSFNQETLTLFERGQTTIALAYVAVTIAGGLACGWVGLSLGR